MTEPINPDQDLTAPNFQVPEPVMDNSKMFGRMFSFRGRIRQSELLISYLIVIAFYIPLEIMPEEDTGEIGWVIFAWVWFFLTIPILWFLFAQSWKRSHDIGRTGWMSFIPFAWLWLLIAQGNDGVNAYGSDPRQPYEGQLKHIPSPLANGGIGRR